MKTLKYILRMLWVPFGILSFFNGSRKMAKKVAKNQKLQDPDYYSEQERWSYAVKKVGKFVKNHGAKIEIINEDNIPKGPCFITPNHTSMLDGFVLMVNAGKDNKMGAVIKKELMFEKGKGYVLGLPSFLIDRNDLRQSLAELEKAAKWAKANSRPVVIFPEGHRTENNALDEFKPGAFKMAQKYFLPIVPVTIIGAKDALAWKSPKTKIIKVIYHKPIKQSQIMKMKTVKLAEIVQEIIQKDLDKYNKGLSR